MMSSAFKPNAGNPLSWLLSLSSVLRGTPRYSRWGVGGQLKGATLSRRLRLADLGEQGKRAEDRLQSDRMRVILFGTNKWTIGIPGVRFLIACRVTPERRRPDLLGRYHFPKNMNFPRISKISNFNLDVAT